jgi:inverse autotransporter-like protein with beta domain
MRKTLFALVSAPFLLGADEAPPVCESPFHTMRFEVRHTESNGVGYNLGYTTAQLFGSYDKDLYFTPFFDLRGHVFNDGKLVGNFGIGERTFIPSANHFFGLYVYYDVRQESHGLTIQQLSPGFEFVGSRFEYRANAYIPVGKTKSKTFGRQFSPCDTLSLLNRKKKNYALKGADGEVGAHVMQSTNHDVYFGAGPYYFTGKPNTSWGGKARALWRYHDWMFAELSYSYDTMFKNIVQGVFGLSYPFGKKIKCQEANSNLTLSREAFAPYRFEIPVMKSKTFHKNTNINPLINRPCGFMTILSSSTGPT